MKRATIRWDHLPRKTWSETCWLRRTRTCNQLLMETVTHKTSSTCLQGVTLTSSQSVTRSSNWRLPRSRTPTHRTIPSHTNWLRTLLLPKSSRPEQNREVVSWALRSRLLRTGTLNKIRSIEWMSKCCTWSLKNLILMQTKRTYDWRIKKFKRMMNRKTEIISLMTRNLTRMKSQKKTRKSIPKKIWQKKRIEHIQLQSDSMKFHPKKKINISKT